MAVDSDHSPGRQAGQAPRYPRWDWVFKGDIMFDAFEAELTKRYPGIKLISWKEFGEIHGANEHEVLAALPQKFKEMGVDAVICGVGC